MTPPVVLHLSNDLELGPKLSFGGAFGELAADGHLRHVPLAPAELLRSGLESALIEIAHVAAEARPALLFVQSPGNFPWRDESVAAILRQLDSPTVVLWEGAPWGRRKAITPAMTAWLRHADTVFTVGLGAQTKKLGAHTRQTVRYVPQTVPQRLWDTGPVPPPEAAPYDVVHIGSRSVRYGFLERIEGARKRDRLVRSLMRLPDCRFAVYGHGWRGPGALGPVPFDQQILALRTARISAHWDHFPGREGYFSNRLPISLYSGRPQVTSRPLNADWLPGPECGLHLVDSPDEAVDRVAELLRADPAVLHTAGQAGRAWVRTRLTDLNALRHMLGAHLDVPPPPVDPWEAVAAMDSTVRAPDLV